MLKTPRRRTFAFSIMNLSSVSIIAIFLSIMTFKPMDAVFNGKVANIGDFPYMAAICYIREPTCGGAIISDRHVLTAGHCLYQKSVKNYYIMVGASKLLDFRALYFSVKHFHIHPDYADGEYRGSPSDPRGMLMTKPFANDIAIVEIMHEFPLMLPVKQPQVSNRLKFAVNKIPYATGYVGQCVPCIFAGWGGISSLFVDLHTYELIYTILFIRRCNECLRQSCQGDPYTFCTHDYRGITTPGKGDSGGPLVCRGVIAGILSTAKFDPAYPARFTNVALYENFIESIVPPLTKL